VRGVPGPGAAVSRAMDWGLVLGAAGIAIVVLAGEVWWFIRDYRYERRRREWLKALDDAQKRTHS
jgi:hypothetical protein